MRTFATSALLSLCLLAAPAAQAADLQARFTDNELIQILKGEGYSTASNLKPGAISLKIEGKSYVLFNGKDGDLQLYYGIGGAKVNAEDMNTWNRTKRLSRAYLDSDKDPVLESDLMSDAGLSRKHVTEFLRVFVGSVEQFRRFVADRSQ
jgi:hypothetical protein